MRLLVIYEDNHLLVLNKPAGLATMGVTADRPSLFRQAKSYIKRKYGKPGNVYLGVVSRLDLPVSGVVLFARTSKAAARLAAQFRARRPRKTYLAIVEGDVRPAQGELRDALLRDERARRVRVVERDASGALDARLSYETLPRRCQAGTPVRIALQTGRKHQIRVQLAARGWPIVGDQLYGSRRHFRPGIALHAWKLVLDHPTRHDELTFTAALPSNWPALAVDEPDR
jgi:23S rRNA pseudouridine1911/1915/1917 synthase